MTGQSLRCVVLDRVGIVVPVHNEEQTLERCLHGLAAAVSDTDVACSIVVVLDSCTDQSVHIAAKVIAELGLAATCIETAAATVGGARRDGVEHLLTEYTGADVESMWIATTDADSVVPPHWLSGQLGHARAGAQIVAGTVTVEDWTLWPTQVEARYRAHYAQRPVVEGHGHIHGANLGLRADIYIGAGGFSPVAADEDVDLIRRAQAAGARVTWAVDIAVATSARHHGRAPAGFARHLRDLATQIGNPQHFIEGRDDRGDTRLLDVVRGDQR